MLVNPSRIGQVNLAGATDELFLKVFSGEIITTFEKYNTMMPLHRVRTIQSGKSATFPVTGVATAGYHTPGESVLSQAAESSLFAAGSSGGAVTTAFTGQTGTTSKYLSRLRHNEKIIFIDDVLVSSVFVADIDEMMNHYDVRSVYSTEIGRALAYTADRNLLRTVIAGARRSTDRFGGSSSDFLGKQVGIGTTPTGDGIIQALFDVARRMDDASVPQDNRVCILNPTQYYNLVRTGKDAINHDFNDGSNGSIAKGEIITVAGIRILKSNQLPSLDETGGSESVLHGAAGVKNNVVTAANTGTLGYSGIDYSTTRGIVFHQEAVGTVKLMDLSVESEYQMDRLGTLMLAKYAMGHNVLREECCYELTATAFS